MSRRKYIPSKCGDYEKGKAISGNLAPAESIIFHAGTAAAADGTPVTRMGLSLKKYTKAAASASAATVSAVPRECSIRVAIAAFIYS